jgi:hypothetical protein
LVIVDAISGQVSLIHLLETIPPMALLEPGPGAPADQESARFLLGPFAVFSHWSRETGDEGQQFEQALALVAPDGREALFPEITPFEIERPFHRILYRTGPIPLRLTGPYQLVLKIRASGTEQWREITRYPLIVADIPQEQPQEPAPEVL